MTNSQTQREDSELAVEEMLQSAIDAGRQSGYVQVETFEGVGMMTNDRGLVLTFEDGSEFQVTIVRSN